MEHMKLRLEQRINDEIKDIINNMVNNLISRAKQKTLPKTKWYKAVLNDDKIIAYICGKGTSVKTVLAGDMIPYGVQI